MREGGISGRNVGMAAWAGYGTTVGLRAMNAHRAHTSLKSADPVQTALHLLLIKSRSSTPLPACIHGEFISARSSFHNLKGNQEYAGQHLLVYIYYIILYILELLIFL